MTYLPDETDPSSGAPASGERAGSRRALGCAFEVVETLVLTLLIYLVIHNFVAQPFGVQQSSMVPTIVNGEYILIDKLTTRFNGYHYGDVVVFNPPSGAEEEPSCGEDKPNDQVCLVPSKRKADVNFIKRIVAGPGDELRVVDGRVILNGKRQEEDFTRACGRGDGCNFPEEVTIPADHYFMMGDNRGQSDDSRFWGPVPRDWIIGPAFATYWPPKRIGLF